MLNQNLDDTKVSQTNTPSSPAAAADNVRVSTEEFVAAINRIDKRRAQESEQINGTVAIGQTLQDLHVDATADEVLREIEKMRQEAVPVVKTTQPKTIGASQAVAESSEAALKQEKRARRKKNWLQAAAALGFVMLGAGLQYANDQENTPDINHLAMLSTLQSGQEMFVPTDTVEKLMASGGSTAATSSLLGESQASGSYRWPVIKKNNMLYVLAYVDPSEQVGKTSTLHMHNYDTDSTPKNQPIATIPIAGSSIVNTDTEDSDNQQITIETSTGGTPQ